MTVHTEEIARLTGTLVFDTKVGPLLAFEQILKRVQASMAGMMKTADDLNKRLDRKLGISTRRDASTAANAAVQKSLDKQIATEGKLARLRQSQFRAALAEQKLTSVGKREESFLQSAALKRQVTAAVLSAKQHKAEQEALKVDLGRAKVQASAEQSKIREARLADILQRRQERTVQLQQQAALHQSKLQRAEAGLLAARERGVRLAERHQASKLASAAREVRAATRTEQTSGRYAMATERHAAWQARQAEPQGLGLSGLTIGIGAAGAALYALTEAAGYLGERIKQRQETAADNQQFDNTLMAAGNNDKERVRIKEAYIQNSQEFGMKIDRESAVAYSNMVQGFRAQGKTLEEAIQLQKDQAAVFRIGNLDKTQQYSAALQLNQGYSKDRFMGQDLRPLTDALGTRLTTILYQAIGKALGYKGDINKLAGFVLEAQHDGKVNGAMVQQGMRDIVAQSPELLERHKHSLDAQAVRVENDKYLQAEKTNSDPELIAALGDRLTAERQLIESTSGLQAAFRDFDVVLVKLQTSMLHMMTGKNADNTDKTPQQKAEEVGAAYTIEGSGVDPYAFNGGKSDASGKKSVDPISQLWGWLTNRPDYSKGEFTGRVAATNALSITPPELSLGGLNTGGLPNYSRRLENLMQSDLGKSVAALANEPNRSAPQSRGYMVADTPSANASTIVNNDNQTTTVNNDNRTTTVNAPPVALDITVNVKTDANPAEIATAVSGQVREEMQRTFQSYLPKEVQ
jgi:hypothetical protein